MDHDTSSEPPAAAKASGTHKRQTEPCSVPRCGKPVAASGHCWKHYSRIRRHGDVTLTLRRYRKTHKCRFCGTRNPDDFYEAYKSICKTCRKLRLLRVETTGRNTAAPAPAVTKAS